MRFKTIEAFDIPDAWYQVVHSIWHEGDDYGVVYGSEETLTKKLALSIQINHPENRPLAHEKAPTDDKQIGMYSLEYLYSQDKKDHPYTYGSRLGLPIDQYDMIVQKLARHVYDRQCTAVIRRPEDLLPPREGEKSEPPCLTMLDFEIVDNMLIPYTYWRSWDAYAGLPENLGGVQILVETMANDIKELNPKLSGLKTGPMFAFSKNCHLYIRQFKDVEHLFTTPPDSRRMSK